MHSQLGRCQHRHQPRQQYGQQYMQAQDLTEANMRITNSQIGSCSNDYVQNAAGAIEDEDGAVGSNNDESGREEEEGEKGSVVSSGGR
jgi:hypothetical protein